MIIWWFAQQCHVHFPINTLYIIVLYVQCTGSVRLM